MASVAGLTAATIVGRALAPRIVDNVAKALRLKSHEVRARFISTFENHVESTRSKCSKVRTILTGDNEVNIKSIYTNIYLNSEENRIRDDDFLNFILSNSINAVVSGTGGAGKTMLMKYLSLLAIEEISNKIPLFIELRNLPDHIPANFNQNVFEQVTDEAHKDNYDIFRQGLINGTFIIFFDGLYEVTSEKRGQIFNSINRYRRDFPNSRVVLSTRPDSYIRQWGSLRLYKVGGLKIEQIRTLISKLPDKRPRRDAFLEMLTEKFYDKHNSFLSVPLLCSLMFLTFHEFQEVPSRMTVFYEQAFETLMRSHDRAKEGFFKREHECGLSADRFRTLFSALCYRTLALGAVSFTDAEIREHIIKSSKASEIEVDSDKYIADLASGVCVIIRDGLKLHFIHRSFQEYFAAIHLVRHKSSDAYSLYERIASGPSSNDVMAMAYDIDRKAFEREWALPILTKFTDLISTQEPTKLGRFILEALNHQFTGGLGSKVYFISVSRRRNTLAASCHEIFKVYGDEFKGLFPHFGFIGDEGKSWDDYVSDTNIFPKKLFRLISSYNKDKLIADEFLKPMDLSEVSDEFLSKLGILDQGITLANAMSDLRELIERRVIERENIDILN
jgi:hypothetical protein